MQVAGNQNNSLLKFVLLRKSYLIDIKVYTRKMMSKWLHVVRCHSRWKVFISKAAITPPYSSFPSRDYIFSSLMSIIFLSTFRIINRDSGQWWTSNVLETESWGWLGQVLLNQLNRKNSLGFGSFTKHFTFCFYDFLFKNISAIALFTIALDRLRNKLKSISSKRSAEILRATSEEIFVLLQNAESHIKTDV